MVRAHDVDDVAGKIDVRQHLDAGNRMALDEHPFFRRMGDNIHCSVPLTVTEAALGTKIEVPTIDGRAIARIPPGTQSGQTFRMRGRGAPSLLNPGMRGDQYIEVKVVVPRVADERSKQILRELAKLNPEDPRKGLWQEYTSW